MMTASIAAAAPTANQAIDALQFGGRGSRAPVAQQVSISIRIIAIGMVEDAPETGVEDFEGELDLSLRSPRFFTRAWSSLHRD